MQIHSNNYPSGSTFLDNTNVRGGARVNAIHLMPMHNNIEQHNTYLLFVSIVIRSYRQTDLTVCSTTASHSSSALLLLTVCTWYATVVGRPAPPTHIAQKTYLLTSRRGLQYLLPIYPFIQGFEKNANDNE